MKRDTSCKRLDVCCRIDDGDGLPSMPKPDNSFPSRPVTIIVPFAAGGPLDTLARVLSNG